MDDFYIDSKISLLDETRSYHHTGSPNRRQRCWPYISLALNVCFAIIATVWLGENISTRILDPFNNRLLRQTSIPSPIFNHMHIDTPIIRRAGAVMSQEPQSIWRQEPSPEIDQAWYRIANSSPIAITAQDVRNIGEDPAKVVKWPPEFGLGDDAYWGSLDVFHQIHCLNMLRKAIHWEYYSEFEKYSEASAVQKSHIGHCLHTLVQELMCQANTDPYVWYWVDASRMPIPDWSNKRQCRDFESILSYQEKHGIARTRVKGVIEKPADAWQRALSLEFKYLREDLINDPAINRTAALLEDEEKFGRSRGDSWRDESWRPSPDFM